MLCTFATSFGGLRLTFDACTAIYYHQVTSPGGTTIAAVHQLELGRMRGTVINAVMAAAEKSAELGQSSIE